MMEQQNDKAEAGIIKAEGELLTRLGGVLLSVADWSLCIVISTVLLPRARTSATAFWVLDFINSSGLVLNATVRVWVSTRLRVPCLSSPAG